MKYNTLILPAILMALMIMGLIHPVFSLTELAYDDGNFSSWVSGGNYFAVKFSLSDFGLSSFKLGTVRLHLLMPGGPPFDPIRIHVLDSAGVTDLITPFEFTATNNKDWNNADLPGGGIILTDDFWIAINHLTGITSRGQTIQGSTHSYTGIPGTWTEAPFNRNYAIRALSGSATDSIGGLSMPVNKLEILTPYIALAGLIIAVSTVYVVKRRKD
ncbi:hypothetical protein ACFLQ6_01555 [Thermoproteota archaeon]